jgi:hypothetical protein
MFTDLQGQMSGLGHGSMEVDELDESIPFRPCPTPVHGTGDDDTVPCGCLYDERIPRYSQSNFSFFKRLAFR